MARTGGDEDPSGGAQPGGEPAPAEVWISDGIDREPAHAGGAPAGPGPGHHGGTGRARWIALAAGFAVLLAVIAVQHHAGDSRAGGAAPPSSAQPGPTPAGSSESAGGSSPAGDGPVASSAGPTAGSRSAAPVGSMVADTSASGTVVSSATEDPESAAEDIGPRTSVAAAGPFPTGQHWTLLGYGPAGLVRFRPGTGQVVVTPVPPIPSGNPISFLTTPTATIIRPMDGVGGYLVPDGKPAAP